MNSTNEENSAASGASARRSFMTRALAIVVGGMAMLFPFAVGAGVVLHPLRRSKKKGDQQADLAGFVRICQLSALPADGLPHPFVVTTDVTDAWTHASNQRVGAVFLLRADAEGKPTITAFTAACPHLGCAVEFDSSRDRFECPCHESGFAKDGQKLFGPSLRGLDSLEVKLIGNDGAQDVLIAFRRFRAGVAERIPVG
jgi:menaquinol-cytochrome c reductase iron-sulfur subunit